MLPKLQKTAGNRLVIYAKDVMIITGKSERTARHLLQRIRERNGKKQGNYVSLVEFCEFTGLKEEMVRGVIG